MYIYIYYLYLYNINYLIFSIIEDNNTNKSQFQNKTPLNSIDWKDIINRNANNKIVLNYNYIYIY